MSRDELITKAQKGDTESLFIIMAHMKRTVREWLYCNWKPANGGPELDDMVQLCMINVLRGIKNYKPAPNGKFFAWLWMYVRSAVKDEYKSRRYYKNILESSALSLNAPAPTTATRGTSVPLTYGDIIPSKRNTDDILDDIHFEIIYKALTRKLTPLELRVLSGSIQGMKSREISAVTGIHPKAIDNAKERIKIKTRKILEGEKN